MMHRLLAWGYARWCQLLEYGDLLGVDGRPSQSKLAAVTVLWVGAFIALWSVTKHQATGPGAGAVTLVIAGLAASFGRSMLARFLERWSGSASTGDTAAPRPRSSGTFRSPRPSDVEDVP
jgi:hypothetical protein